MKTTVYAVQFNPCEQLYYFSSGGSDSLVVGDRIVVHTGQGESIATIMKVLYDLPSNHILAIKKVSVSADQGDMLSDFGPEDLLQMDETELGAELEIELEPELTSEEDEEVESECRQTEINQFEEIKKSSELKDTYLSDSLMQASEAGAIDKVLLVSTDSITSSDIVSSAETEVLDSKNSINSDKKNEDSNENIIYVRSLKPILRIVSENDLNKEMENKGLASKAGIFCKECILKHGLEMKLVRTDMLLDKSKILFYFTAPNRIDFRELVKDLVREYHVRIELRQIGVRHETQMVGALGNCGMTCCCRRYMRAFEPVSIRMAKEQNLFLNPTKISGTCGRLLCCLAFEQESYEEFQKKCPKIGKKYITDEGIFKVLRSSLFRLSLNLLTENNEEVELKLDEWMILNPKRLDSSAENRSAQATVFVELKESDNLPTDFESNSVAVTENNYMEHSSLFDNKKNEYQEKSKKLLTKQVNFGLNKFLSASGGDIDEVDLSSEDVELVELEISRLDIEQIGSDGLQKFSKYKRNPKNFKKRFTLNN